ncbi:LysR substrate-binding domain-containing protein [Pendulispora brunnea]|uniref:LysR substrate-binding domain-containing protein n=1 Tax=Pendulispora brunnea TaxID=2905690 RepID=A0ABZ2KC92_9BACT
MRTFRSVITTGSFAAAARSAQVTTASISKQVSQLEEHLGSQLLNRTTRRLSLTDAGRIYLEHCERILDEVDEAERSLNNLHAEPRGRLRIAVPMSFGLLRIAPLLAPFALRYPEIELDVALNDRVVDLVEEGFDLAIRIFARPLEDSALIMRRIGGGKRVVCAAPAYLRARGTPKHPQDLEAHDCLRYALHAAPAVWEFDGPHGQVSVKIRGPLLTNNSIAIRDATVGGLGIALVPDFIVTKELAEKRVKPLLERYSASGYGIFMVAPPSRYVAPKVRAFAEFLTEALR